MGSTITVGAPEPVEIEGNGVTARATIALAPTSRRGVWVAMIQREQVAERRRMRELKSTYSAEDWPEIHAGEYTTPEGIEASAALWSAIVAETVQSLRLTYADARVEQVTGPQAAAALDRAGLLQVFGMRVLAAHAMRPSTPSSPESSGGEGQTSASSASSTSSPTT